MSVITTSTATVDASSVSLDSLSPTPSSSHFSLNTNHHYRNNQEPINLRIWKNNNSYFSRRSKLRPDTSCPFNRLKKKVSLRAYSSSGFSSTGSGRASDSEALSHHSNFILSGFNALKSNRILCDVTLVAQEKRFDVHKVIMASCSDYFRSMFTGGMKECQQSVIELKAVSALGLEKLIEIVYTSSASFETHIELFDAVSAASHLQCLLVIDFCEKNFIQRINLDNYGMFIKMAQLYQLDNALKDIDLFIANNLVDLINRTTSLAGSSCSSSSEDSYKFLTYEQLLKCLVRNDIRIREIDLFLLTWKWIKNILLTDSQRSFQQRIDKFLNSSNQDSSKKTVQGPTRAKKKINIIRSLMKQIRFGLIAPSDIVNKVQGIHKIMLNDTYLRHLVLKALNYHVLPSVQSTLGLGLDSGRCSDDDEENTYQHILDNHPMNINLRSPVKSILTIGGREINPNPTLHNKCYILNDYIASSNLHHDADQRIELAQLPNTLSHMQTVVVSSNFLYVLGGCTSQCAHGESAVSTVHRYDPRLNAWITVNPMETRRAYFYACVLTVDSGESGADEVPKRKQFIYAVAGKNREGALSSVERYDMAKNTWEFVRSMPASYYAHSGCVLNDMIYVTGGYTQNQFTADVHCYSPTSDQWQQLRQMNSPRGWHCMCVANSNIYVFGGCFLNQSNVQENMNSTLSTIASLQPNQMPHQQPQHHQQHQQHQQQQPVQQVAQGVTCTEFYSLESGRWSVARPMLNLHKEASCFKMNDYIYVIGGYNILTKTGQRMISRYDFSNDVWDSMVQNQLPSGVTGMGLAVIDLPWFALNETSSTLGVFEVSKTALVGSRSWFNSGYLYDESDSESIEYEDEESSSCFEERGESEGEWRCGELEIGGADVVQLKTTA